MTHALISENEAIFKSKNVLSFIEFRQFKTIALHGDLILVHFNDFAAETDTNLQRKVGFLLMKTVIFFHDVIFLEFKSTLTRHLLCI